MEGFPVVIEIQPRFRDTDAMGHLNNVVYLTYFEEARAAYWTRLMGTRAFDRVPFILAHSSIDHRSPAYVHERLRVGVRLSRLGVSSFDAEYRIEEMRSGRVVAEGRSVQVAYDYGERRTVPLPEDLKQRFRQFEGRAEL